ncbi:hypothetical protein HMPREF2785_07280 [Corynebacterium sp. HMSC067D03]|uniref:hypothetical protein n=1 Tax=unclassified Corynebacterium TaxID=2624378 RepID=UPI0008A38302|nr:MULTISPECIES: hypothetical protein [unclassified Corynebacterium]OFL17747.1 hypothetical protein HMPREF2785_07280 [Corynebacterium sp. HMSC067D03]OFO34536.1 hypothetical protein HMPREF3048_08655 [Corynebacterium sp. HMSC075D04]
MYTFHVDETGRSGNTTFFYLGGLVADEEQFIAGTKGVAAIREKYDYGDTDLFKFTSNSRPDHLTFAEWTASKSEALELINKLGIKLLVTMVHHKIANPLKRNEGVTWNMENLFRHYAKSFLRENPGAVCLDRIDENWGHTELEKIAQSQIEYGEKLIGIPQIIHFAFTSARFSKFNSLVDIALGSFHRCCENAFDGDEQKRSDTTRKLMKHLYPCLAKDPVKGVTKGYGLYPQPLNVGPAYIGDYEKVYDYLKTHLPDARHD